MGAASVSSLSWSAVTCSSRAFAAFACAWRKRFASTDTLARSSSRVHGCGDEVDRARRVAVGHDLVGRLRGDEDDRGQLRLRPQPDQGGGLEAVHDRHPYVEQDDREVVGHARSAGASAPDSASTIVVAQRRQHRPQRQPLRRVVVDDQDRGGQRRDAGGPGRRPRERASPCSWRCSRGRPARSRAGSHGFRAASSSPVSTGLGM